MEYGLVVLWLLCFFLLGAVGFPLATWLLRDGVAGTFALPVSLATLTVVAHLTGHLRFGLFALLAGLVVLFALSAVAFQRVPIQWRSLAEPAAVFTVGFVFVVAIRSFDPAAAPLPLAIGEKFLDFGLVRSLQRSPTLPPTDMWFAGETVRYYYGGHLMTALLTMLTGTEVRFAYNLALAGFYATLVTAAYGLAGAVATELAASRRLAGGLGAFFVGVAGNLVVAAQVIAWLAPDPLVAWLVSQTSHADAIAEWSPSEFSYFDASRVIPVDPSAEETYMAATEFPLFAWLNGDLHAHMMSQPFVLLAAALLFAYWRAEDQPGRRAVLLFGALPAVAGLVAVMNTWAFPTVGGLAFLTVLFAPGDPARLGVRHSTAAELLRARDHWALEEGRRLGLAVVATVAVLALGVAWSLPYWTQVLLGGPDTPIAYWEPWTPLTNLLLAHGAFLAVFVPYLALRAGPRVPKAHVDAGIVLALAVAAILFGFPAVGLFVPILVVCWWLLWTDSGAGFETVLVLAGVGLVLLVEVVTMDGERFNVIFKPYVDVWLFWSVAAGAVLARLAGDTTTPELSVPDRTVSRAGRALAVVLVLSTGAYASFALPAHFADPNVAAAAEGPTLDSTAYVDHQYPEEAEAIRWLDDREGQPVIVTAAPGGYWWRPAEGDGASAPASISGLPTVLGWHHERQYRGPEAYSQRVSDVETIYTGPPAEQVALLDSYDVEYVYVGPAERARYDSVTVDERQGVTVAKSAGGVTIYRVDDEQLRE